MIQIQSDYSALERELGRFEKMPDFKTKKALDMVLKTGFEATQAAVHIETGSLKESGKEESEVSKIDHQWEGTITYGGPSSGPNNPVNYAIYEQRRGVGGAGGPSDLKGNHDFIAPMRSMHPFWVAAIKKGLRG